MGVKQHIVRGMALIAGVWLIGAAEASDRGWEGRERWAGLPPEQRQQMRQQMREHWQQMPPEQREVRRQEYRERWQQMPSDERQRMRDEMREQRGYEGRRGERR